VADSEKKEFCSLRFFARQVGVDVGNTVVVPAVVVVVFGGMWCLA